MNDKKQVKSVEQIRKEAQEAKANTSSNIPLTRKEIQEMTYEADKKREMRMVKELRKRGWTVKRLADKQTKTYILCGKCKATFELFRERGYAGQMKYCPFCGAQAREGTLQDGPVNLSRQVVE